MFTSIAGRAVVVTGGSRGIGKGIASVFARNGARVLITGRDADVARAAAEELDALAERPGEVSFIQADVSNREDCRRMAANAQERLGGVDVLCANAGVFPDSLLADMTEEMLDQVLGTNLRARSCRSRPACPRWPAPAAAASSSPPPLPGRSPGIPDGRPTARARPASC